MNKCKKWCKSSWIAQIDQVCGTKLERLIASHQNWMHLVHTQRPQNWSILRRHCLWKKWANRKSFCKILKTKYLEFFCAQVEFKSRKVNHLTLEHALTRYPCPIGCIWDNDNEFKTDFRKLIEGFRIQYRPTAAKNPQANAIIERVHGVINDIIQT